MITEVCFSKLLQFKIGTLADEFPLVYNWKDEKCVAISPPWHKTITAVPHPLCASRYVVSWNFHFPPSHPSTPLCSQLRIQQRNEKDLIVNVAFEKKNWNVASNVTVCYKESSEPVYLQLVSNQIKIYVYFLTCNCVSLNWSTAITPIQHKKYQIVGYTVCQRVDKLV